MGKIFGIDFGMMNSCVVVVEGLLMLCVFVNCEGSWMMVFIVVFVEDGDWFVG